MGRSAPLTERPRMAPLARRLWRQLSGADRARLVTAMVLMLVAAAGDAAVPAAIGRLVNEVVSHPKDPARTAVVTSLGIIAAVLLGVQLLQVIRRQLVETTATAYERETRTHGLSHVLYLPGTYLARRQSGAVYMRTTRGIEGSAKLLKLAFMDFLPTIALAGAAVIAALLTNLYIGLVTLGVIPTGLLLVRWQIRSQDGIRTKIRDAKEDIDGSTIELLPAQETVRAYGAEPFFSERIRRGSGRVRDEEMRHHRAMGWFDTAKFANEALWFVAVLATAVALVRDGQTGPGQVLTAALLFNKVLTPLRELHRVLDESSESAKQTADLFELLDHPIDPIYSAATGGAASASTTLEDTVVSVRNVLFAYPPRDGEADGKTVLNGVSLDVQRGQRVALVGLTGCGKSTLLKLLDRLEHGYLGEITLFGLPLKEYDQARLAPRVGYLPQTPFVFRASVRDNITFGLELQGRDADALIEQAARRAHVHEVINNLPNGYDTLIDERGTSLSGGQRQRLCLARALLRSPELLLLDEPTSALDNQSQAYVQEAIDQLDGVTIIEVAHRLSSVATADRVLLLEAGVVVQQGTFDELKAAPGPFAELLAYELSAPR